MTWRDVMGAILLIVVLVALGLLVINVVGELIWGFGE